MVRTTALDAVLKQGLSGNQAADVDGVPRSMLKDCLSGPVIQCVDPGPNERCVVQWNPT